MLERAGELLSVAHHTHSWISKYLEVRFNFPSIFDICSNY